MEIGNYKDNVCNPLPPYRRFKAINDINIDRIECNDIDLSKEFYEFCELFLEFYFNKDSQGIMSYIERMRHNSPIKKEFFSDIIKQKEIGVIFVELLDLTNYEPIIEQLEDPNEILCHCAACIANFCLYSHECRVYFLQIRTIPVLLHNFSSYDNQTCCEALRSINNILADEEGIGDDYTWESIISFLEENFFRFDDAVL